MNERAQTLALYGACCVFIVSLTCWWGHGRLYDAILIGQAMIWGPWLWSDCRQLVENHAQIKANDREIARLQRELAELHQQEGPWLH